MRVIRKSTSGDVGPNPDRHRSCCGWWMPACSWKPLMHKSGGSQQETLPTPSQESFLGWGRILTPLA